jgi:uncharacterized oxidoreductase
MPTVMADRLHRFAVELLQGAGASAEEAAIAARHCVDANLAGHDSHGVIQLSRYIDQIRRGEIVPGARLEITQETATTTVVNGHWGLGFAVSERAMQITIDKAHRHKVAAATVFAQSHVGRLADYPLMAAQAGMIGMMTADSGRGPKSVAPFGGKTARLGTNPLCIAVPSNLTAPLFIDMATSAVAFGKVRLAAQRGQPIPTGWLIDAEGHPTTDPANLESGVLLPLGGSEGHKGYGLGVMIEIFSGILTGLGYGVAADGRHNDGCFMAVFDVAAFRPLAEFKQEVTEFAHYLAQSPPAAGQDRVYYPGELEFLRTQQRLKEGIYIEDTTWERLRALARELGLAGQLAP